MGAPSFKIVVSLASLAIACPLAAREARAAPPLQTLSGRIDAVASSNGGVIVVTGHAVRILDPLGYPKRSLWTPSHPVGRRHRASRSDGFSPLPGLTPDSDWSDPIDADVLDDPDDPRLTDETEARTSDIEEPWPPTTSIQLSDPPRSELVAAAEGRAWIARSDGLWRVDLSDGFLTRVLPTGGAGIGAVAVANGAKDQSAAMVAIFSGGRLLRSEDGGQTFEAVAFLESAPRALVVTPTGTACFVDGNGLHVSAPDRHDISNVPLAGVTDVVSCGTDVIALAAGELYTILSVGETIRSEHIGTAPFGARKIVCGADSPLMVAYGAEVSISENHGRTWRARTDVPPAPVTGIAISEIAVWIATSSGLWRLAIPSATPSPAASRSASSVSSSSPPRAAIAPSCRPWRWWATALPRIDLSFTAARTAARRDYRGIVNLTFILDRSTSALSQEPAAAADPRRARLGDQAAQVAVADPGASFPSDPITADERRALAQALEDQQ